MATLRSWLNQHPLGAPYRGVRDILRTSANRRELLELNRQLQGTVLRLTATVQKLEEALPHYWEELGTHAKRLDRLEQHDHESREQHQLHGQALQQLEPLYKSPQLPFSHRQPTAPWIENAERLMGQTLDQLPPEQRDHWFYSFYSEMAGGVGHILEQQYQVYLPLLPKVTDARVLDIGCGAGEFLNFLRNNDVSAIGVDLDAHEVERAN